MGGKCGGPSLRERALNQQIHAQRLASQRSLKPPYECPKCHSPCSLGVKEEILEGNRTFRFRCGKCGLDARVILNGTAFTSLDAYNKLVDQLYVKVAA